MPFRPKPLSVRFWANVEKGPSCWLWTRNRSARYGQIKHQGRLLGVHRVSYELHFGPIPAGLFVCHRCDNPRCVRPDHLFIGTADDNNKDAANKGRTARGSKSAFAKLTEAQVLAFKKRRALGETYAALAREAGVAAETVRNAIIGKQWSHVRAESS